MTSSITARVDRALVDAEVRATTKWVFAEPERDTDPGNNVLVRAVGTAEAGAVSTPSGTATTTSTPASAVGGGVHRSGSVVPVERLVGGALPFSASRDCSPKSTTP